jgi:phosphoribosylaminoimidazole-succinocarboxamide synthase
MGPSERPSKAELAMQLTPFQMTQLLPHARIAELPNPYFGKVRDCYDLPATADNPARRILISSDRISAFDRILAVIPFKGQVLTQMARYWFDQTADICPNHVLAYPDSNVVVGRHVTILPVEIVVRGYLAGTTSTSILTQYRMGKRAMYGHVLPDGLRDNQLLPHPIITPTSKAFDGGHDAPLTPDEILRQGLLSPQQWAEVSAYALALFARGQQIAAQRGLILVDTKYEFGIDGDGRILLADEIHTPDSSRYWIADGYPAALSAGTRPPSFDKDVIRSWVAARCDPYLDDIPEIPPEMIAQTASTYIAAFQAITGSVFVPDIAATSPLDRIRQNLQTFMQA